MEAYYKDDYVTLYHGDSRVVLGEIGSASVDFIFTDPPYGHNNNNNGDLASRRESVFEGRKEEYKQSEEWRPILNDGKEANELVRWFFGEAVRILKPGCCCCCCCGGGGPDPQFARWSLWMDEAFGGGFKHMVIWDKGPMGMGHHYRRSYETILVAQKSGAKCAWYDTSKRVENVIRPRDFGIRKIIPQKHHHPTEKPWQLAARFLGLHTLPGHLVIDPFSGGGSTLVACKQMGRKAIGVEMEERFCDMAARKLQGIMALA